MENYYREKLIKLVGKLFTHIGDVKDRFIDNTIAICNNKKVKHNWKIE